MIINKTITTRILPLLMVAVLLCIVCIDSQAKTVLDQKNRTVQIPDQVSRVVSIPIPMASMIITIDQSSKRLVGINRASHNDFIMGFLPTIYPEVATIPYDIAADGFVPNVETLANLHPDVVLQWNDKGDHIIKPLIDAGLPVVTTIYGKTEYVSDWMRIIGAVLGKEQRAEKLINWFNQQHEEVKQKNQHFTEKEKPTVLYISRFQSGIVVAGRNNSYQGDIEVAGGINAAAEISGITPVTVEQLLLWNPQIILLSTFEANLTPELLYRDAKLQSLSAVKNKRVYIYPRGGFRWDPPSQESTLALNWLSLLFHPQSSASQQHSTVSFRQKIQQAYELLYDYQINDDEIDTILGIDVNRQSASYCDLFCRVDAVAVAPAK